MANRDFSDSQRETIWNRYFNGTSGIDAFGRTVYKSNFECDHVYPKSRGGETTILNGLPLHPDSNLEKLNDLIGTSNGKSFKVLGNTSKGELYVNGIKKTI